MQGVELLYNGKTVDLTDAAKSNDKATLDNAIISAIKEINASQEATEVLDAVSDEQLLRLEEYHAAVAINHMSDEFDSLNKAIKKSAKHLGNARSILHGMAEAMEAAKSEKARSQYRTTHAHYVKQFSALVNVFESLRALAQREVA